jgi:hypothetical protein
LDKIVLLLDFVYFHLQLALDCLVLPFQAFNLVLQVLYGDIVGTLKSFFLSLDSIVLKFSLILDSLKVSLELLNLSLEFKDFVTSLFGQCLEVLVLLDLLLEGFIKIRIGLPTDHTKGKALIQ